MAFSQGLGLNYLNVQIIQVLLGALNCWLIYRAGIIFFNRPVGIIASVIAVFYGPFIIYNSSFLSAVWVVTFNLVFLICLGYFSRERKFGWLIGAGIFMGLSIITRPNSAIFLGLALLYLLFSAIGVPGQISVSNFAGRNIAHPKGCGYRLTLVASMIIPAFLVILPVAGFNYLRSGEFIPVTASGGWVFYCGNNERVKGFDFSPPPEINDRINTYYAGPGKEKLSYIEHLLSRELAQERTGSHLSHRKSSAFWFGEGLGFIRDHPGLYLKLLGKKILASVNGYEPHDVPEVMDRGDRLRGYPLIGPAVLIPLALLGLIICRPRTGGMILYLYLISYFISFLLMYVIPRFRLAVIPVLLIFAAAAVQRLYQEISHRQWLKLTRDVILLVPMAILVNLSTPDIQCDREIVRPAFFHEWKGLTCMKRGEWENAGEEFTKALEINPGSYQARRGLEMVEKEIQ